MEFIKKRILFLFNPDFTKVLKQKFDPELVSHLQLMLFVGIIAGLVVALYNIGLVFFLDITRSIEYNLPNMLNYNASIVAGVFFFYLFAGVFIVSLVSVILNLFVKKFKFVQILQITMYAFTPAFLLGWIAPLLPGLLVWSVVLLYVALQKTTLTKEKKHTINQRD